MNKKFILSLVLLFQLANANDNTYIFEAKGKFAEELKALVEKYSKEGKIEATVYEKSDDPTIINSILGNGSSAGNAKFGKEVYEKSCASCHGKDADKKASFEAKPLKDLSANEITNAIQNYKLQDNYGGSNKILMQNIAGKLNTKELNSIISYLKKGTSGQIQTDDVLPTKTSEGSYLK